MAEKGRTYLKAKIDQLLGLKAAVDHPHSFGDLEDVDTTGTAWQIGYVPKWNGTKLVPAQDEGGVGAVAGVGSINGVTPNLAGGGITFTDSGIATVTANNAADEINIDVTIPGDYLTTGALATALDPYATAQDLTDHEAAANPHPGYLTEAEGDLRYVQPSGLPQIGIVGEYARITTTQNHDGIGVWTGIEWNSDVADAAGWHDPVASPSVFSLPAGTYTINASWQYPQSDAGNRGARLLVGGAGYGADRRQATNGSTANERSATWTLRLAAPTSVQVQSQQTAASGHPIQVGATCVIVKIA